MTELKKTLLFGYSRSSVHYAIKELKRDIAQLEERNADLVRTIAEYQNKEYFISEALTEAKRVAQDILTDSETKAEEMVRVTEEDLTARVQQTESQLRKLGDAKKDIMNQEEFIKLELKQLLKRQMEMIERIDTGSIHGISQTIDDLIGNSYRDLEQTRQIAAGYYQQEPVEEQKEVLADELQATAGGQKAKVAYLSSNSSQATKPIKLGELSQDEIPVFSMDTF